MNFSKIGLFSVWLTLCLSAAGEDRNSPTILAHYMPWYASKPVSGQWGWHWTMNHFDPDETLDDGRRKIASHAYPLIGPYDSGDAHVLEYHALLLKISGIDGVIIDWYGIRDFRDYAVVHRNTSKLIPHLKKAGLEFAICYEDQSIGHMIRGQALNANEAISHAREVFRWLEQHWFADEAYLKIDGRPVLLCFGPQHFSPGQWKEACAEFETKPRIFALPHLSRKFGAAGPFGWPPVAGGKTLLPAEWRATLSKLYAKHPENESAIAVAFPGFHDIYQKAGLHESYGHIAHRDGRTFAETLKQARESGCTLIQVATWNDHGEGTAIEPTREFGYRYLEMVQAGSGIDGFAAKDLELPGDLYRLRKVCTGDAKTNTALDEAAELLRAFQVAKAKDRIDHLRAQIADKRPQ